MSDSGGGKVTKAGLLHWIARIAALAALLPLFLVITGEGGEPTAAEWVYLAFFPFGFSAGYLIGWRWPLVGGWVSLGCMAISLVVTGRVFDLSTYAIWGVLSVPGGLYVIAGLRLRRAADDSEVPGS